MSQPRARTGRAPLRPAGRRPRPEGPVTGSRRPGHPGRASGSAPEPAADPAADPAVQRARWLLMGMFALVGIMFSGWLARIPAVRDALGLGAAELGGILIAGSVGSLATVSVAGVLVNRYGGRLVLYVSTVAFAGAYLLIGLGPTVGSVPLLTAGIFLAGAGFALGNVPLNVETAAVERRMGRTVLPQFHAAFSVGAVLGSGIGALCARADVPLLVQFAATALLSTVWRVLSIPGSVVESLPREAGAGGRRTPRSAAGDPEDGGPGTRLRAARVRRTARPGTALGAWRERRTLLIGVVIMSAALSEGSANDWLALAVVDGFGQAEAVGAAMFGVFVGAMTAVRLLGTRLIDRYGRVVVLRSSGVVSLAGLVLFGAAPSLPLAAVGIAAWGFGAALAVPIGIAAASDDPLRAAGRVAVVSAFSSTASLAAPPLLGLAAEMVGARHALLLITVAMLTTVLLASTVRRPDGDVALGPVAGPGADAASGPATVPVVDGEGHDTAGSCVASGSVRREPGTDGAATGPQDAPASVPQDAPSSVPTTGALAHRPEPARPA